MKLSSILLGLVLAIGLLAPLLAGDRPLWVDLGDTWTSPVFSGDDRAPDGRTWTDIRESSTEDDAGVVIWMPWIAIDPGAVFPGSAGSGPSRDHLLGVDRSGRDQLSRLVHATRTAAVIGLVATGLALIVGSALGALAAFGPRVLRFGIDRLIAAWLGFPVLVAVLAFSSAFSGSIWVTALLIGSFTWTGFARVTRDAAASLRGSERIAVAREYGVGPIGLVLRHAGPELWGPIRVLAAFVCAEAILVEATLSFLGVGVGMTSVSWGSMLRDGRLAAVSGGGWHDWLPPAAMLMVTSLCLHSLADRGASDRRALNAAPEGR